VFTISTASLPPTYKSIYAIGGNTAVFTNGTGNLVYLGWEWFNAAPLGTFNDWTSTLDAAVGPAVPEPSGIALSVIAMVGLLTAAGRSKRSPSRCYRRRNKRRSMGGRGSRRAVTWVRRPHLSRSFALPLD
jgi:hypothetical protein